MIKCGNKMCYNFSPKKKDNCWLPNHVNDCEQEKAFDLAPDRIKDFIKQLGGKNV